MAEYTQNTLTYYAKINIIHKEKLGYLRLWTNLKLAYEEKTIWLKDLTEDQAVEYRLRSIPNCCIYIERDSKLYPKNSLLPCGNIPSLLWTPIARAIPVILPKFNDNFMGIKRDKQIAIHLVQCTNEQEAFAMITSRFELEQYISTAPLCRLQNLKWTILSDTKVLIVGLPLLPIKGDVFWRYKHLLLPVGFTLNYSILLDRINEICTAENQYACWFNQDSYTKINIDQLEDLSIASFRISYNTFENV